MCKEANTKIRYRYLDEDIFPSDDDKNFLFPSFEKFIRCSIFTLPNSIIILVSGNSMKICSCQMINEKDFTAKAPYIKPQGFWFIIRKQEQLYIKSSTRTGNQNSINTYVWISSFFLIRTESNPSNKDSLFLTYFLNNNHSKRMIKLFPRLRIYLYSWSRTGRTNVLVRCNPIKDRKGFEYESTR